jgi:hypothetical protein
LYETDTEDSREALDAIQEVYNKKTKVHVPAVSDSASWVRVIRNLPWLEKVKTK